MKTKANSLSALALQKYKKITAGVLGFWFVVLCALTAIFAYILAPDNSSNANQMHLEIHSKKLGFEVLMLTIPSEKLINLSFFNLVLFGKKNPQTEIPISNYSVSVTDLTIYTYTENNAVSLTRTFPLSKFQGKNISTFFYNRFIKTKLKP
ncbi:MAG: hypothetical protein JJE44_01410 [Flavobacteriaceae bacterium]|nr:hypothetical protein [Flavobacteriaceae bacterium]